MTDRADLLQGTLDLLILKSLQLEPLHGWGIAKRIQLLSREVLQVETGSLYPALHRLERKGWVSAKWQVSDKGQRVREYELTLRGREQLAVERSKWEIFSEAMARIMTPPREVGQ